MSEPNGPQVYVPLEQRDEMLRLINGNRRAAGLLPQEYPGHDPYDSTPCAHGRLSDSCLDCIHDELTRLRALQPPADLPATLASVEDVAAVCRAAGMPDGDMLWSTDECDVTADAGYIWPGHELALESVTIDGSQGQVAFLRPGVAGSLLWHAIQAARSTS